MTRVTGRIAVVEQGEFGFWSAYVHLGDDIVIGCGERQGDAEAELRLNHICLLTSIDDRGLAIPTTHLVKLVFELRTTGLSLLAQFDTPDPDFDRSDPYANLNGEREASPQRLPGIGQGRF